MIFFRIFMATIGDNLSKSDMDLVVAIKTISENLSEVTQEDLYELVEVLVKFEWTEDMKTKVVLHLEALDGENADKKRRRGPGRGHTQEKEVIKEVNKAVEYLGEHRKYLIKENIDLLLETCLANGNVDKSIVNEKLVPYLSRCDMGVVTTRGNDPDILEQVENLSAVDRVKLCRALARAEKKSVCDGAHKFKTSSLEDLINVNCELYFKSVNPCIVAFVEGFIDSKKYKVDIKLKEMVICHVHDCIQRLLDHHFLSPLGVKRNYFILKMTGSKTVVNLLSKLDGSGTYYTLKNLDQATADMKVTHVKPADLHLVSDNEQGNQIFKIILNITLIYSFIQEAQNLWN